MKKRVVTFVIGMLLVTAAFSGCAPAPSTVSPTSTPFSWGSTPTPIPGYTASPDWLPAGMIVFGITPGRVEGTVDKGSINLVHSDGTGLVRLANGPDAWNEAPAWSHDGTRIVYSSGTFTNLILWAINADGSHPVQLMHPPQGGSWSVWSPDGTRIAFVSGDLKTFHISLMNADGSNQKTLTSDSLDMFPSWAPNGTILFLRKNGDYLSATGDVFAINPDGTGIVQLTNVGYGGNYALSPDGMKIAIYNMKDHRIEVVPASAGGVPVTLVNSDFGCLSVAMSWSPDGQALALACSDLEIINGSPLYIFKADGSSYTTVPNIEGAYDPAWRPTQ